MPAKIDATLEQQTRTGPSREFQIVEGKEIRIISGTGARQQSYSVQLLALADKSLVRLHLAWGWLGLLFFCLLAIFGYMFARSSLGISLQNFEFVYVAGFSLAAIASLVMFILKLARKRVFVSRLARVRLFDILIGKPNNRSYKAFLSQLNDSLQKAREFWNLKPEHQIAGEVRMLRRLSEEGVIGKSDYEQAKKKLLHLQK